VSLTSAQLKRMAELLRVDELVEYGLLRPAYGFAMRVGQLVEKVEIDEPILSARNQAGALDRFVRELFAAAQKLRVRAEQAERRDALRGFIDSARPVVPIEVIPLSMPASKIFDLDAMVAGYAAQASQMTYSALGLNREQLGIPADVDDNPEPLTRFAAVARELENL